MSPTRAKRGVDFYVIGEGAVTYSVNGQDVASAGPATTSANWARQQQAAAATVTAATDVTVYGMIGMDLRALMEGIADIAGGLQQVMAKR